MLPYIEQHIASGGRLNNIVRHMLGLYHAEPRGRLFRRHLSENAPRDAAPMSVLQEALEYVESGPRRANAAE